MPHSAFCEPHAVFLSHASQCSGKTIIGTARKFTIHPFDVGLIT